MPCWPASTANQSGLVTLTFDLLTLKVVSQSRVTWTTSVQILVFLGLSVLDLGPGAGYNNHSAVLDWAEEKLKIYTHIGQKTCTIFTHALTLSIHILFWILLASTYLNKFATKRQKNYPPLLIGILLWCAVLSVGRCPSVSLPVSPPVTLVHCIQTAKDIKLFLGQAPLPNSNGSGKISIFDWNRRLSRKRFVVGP